MFPRIVYIIAILPVLLSCSDTKPVNPDEPVTFYEALRKNPDDTAALYARAKYFIAQKKLDSALIDMQQLIRLDSSRANYFVTLGDIYLFSNRTRFTRQAFEKAISLNPENEEAHMKLAELFLYVEMHKEALDQLNAVLKINVRNPKAYYMKGMVYKEAGDTSLALSSFLTATDQDPSYALAFEQMGLIYAVKRDKRAPDFYKTALKINANSPTIMYNLGLYYQENGEPERAIETYQELLRLSPGHAHAAYNIGFIKSEIDRKPQEALEWFQKAVSLNPAYAEAHYMVGYCQEAGGRKADAIEAYQKSLKASPSFILARQALQRLGAEPES